ncbi:MAG TPA: hypothetical protein VIM79_13700 [Niastella sp.]
MKKKKTERAASPGSTQPVKPSPAATKPKQQAPAATTNGFKAFILLVAAVISMLIFFGIEPNKLWFTQRIMSYWEEFKEQKLNLDLEERKLARYQTDYLFAKNVTGFFEKRGNANKVLLLLPPSDYFAANGLQIHVPEPAVFYYMTGLKTIWANSPEAGKANWVLTAKNGGLTFDSVINKQTLQDTIAAFKKFNITL